MKVGVLTPAEARTVSETALALHASDESLASVAGVAAALRRAASLRCPLPPGQLVREVWEATEWLFPAEVLTKEQIADVLDLLVSCGDLLELPAKDSNSESRQIYLAPPSYIKLIDGKYLLLGVRPHAAPILTLGENKELACSNVEHVRFLSGPAESAEKLLAKSGLQRLTPEIWAGKPGRLGSKEFLSSITAALAVAQPPGEIPGLEILDSSARVRFYRGRWRQPSSQDSGMVVARRPREYGSDLWCLVELDSGNPVRMLELPRDNSVTPGRDEAWRIQAAIDAERGVPQEAQLRKSSESAEIDVFSPLPGFAERFLHLIATPMPKARGALMTFKIDQQSTPRAIEFLEDTMWMKIEEA